MALLLPLTGPQAPLGQALQQTAEMVYFEHFPSEVELIFRDTHIKGAAAATKSVLSEKVDLILGPVFTTDARAILTLAQAQRVPIVTFSNDYTLAQKNVYVFGLSPKEQIEQMIQYAYSQGIDRLALFTPANAYGKQIRDTVQSLGHTGKITLAANITYTGHGEKLEEEIRKLQAVPLHAVLLPVGGPELHHLSNNLSAFGLDLTRLRLLGTSLWENPEVQRFALLKGGWFTAPDFTKRQFFEEQFRDVYGQSPKRLATLMRDALTMVLTLKAENLPLSAQNLTRSQGFDGIDGPFWLTKEGFTKRIMAVFEVTPQGFKLLTPNATDIKTQP